jgi:aminocarboxymuconate-semialdehyde decarboxylase
MKIDIHGHFTPRAFYNELETLPGVTVDRRSGGISFLYRNGLQWLPFNEAMFEPDHQLRDMDRKQIDIRVLSLSTPSVYLFDALRRIQVCRAMNDLIIERVRRDPSRFRAFATLPLPDVEASLIELERVRHSEGIVGITIGSNMDGLALSSPTLEPLWQALHALRMPVFEHPMVPVYADAMDEFTLPMRVGFFYDTSLAMCRMIYAGVFERYPDFPFVVAHTGACFLDLMERLDSGFLRYPDCRKFITRRPSEYAKRLYYDTCCFFPPLIMMAHQYFGRDRILFGTDYPFIDQDDAHVRELPLPESDKALILGGNAASMLKLKPR